MKENKIKKLIKLIPAMLCLIISVTAVVILYLTNEPVWCAIGLSSAGISILSTQIFKISEKIKNIMKNNCGVDMS